MRGCTHYPSAQPTVVLAYAEGKLCAEKATLTSEELHPGIVALSHLHRGQILRLESSSHLTIRISSSRIRRSSSAISLVLRRVLGIHDGMLSSDTGVDS